MTSRRARRLTTVTAAVAAVVLVGCGGEDAVVVGAADSEDVGEVVLRSDESTASVEPVCVADIPEDLTACPGAPQNVGLVELNRTRTATLLVPQDVASGGYRVRVNGEPLPQHDGVLEDLNQVLRIPVPVVQSPGPTVLTVEALTSREHPSAVWQFRLSDPAGPPD